jgi:hypothetical protein
MRKIYNWINPTYYVDYNKLKDIIVPLMQEDLREWMINNPIETSTECAYAPPDEVEEKILSKKEELKAHKNRAIAYKEILTDEAERKHYNDWRSIDFLYECKWNKEVFKRSWQLMSECKGIKQIFINFIKPNGIITPHLDTSTWEKIEEDWGLPLYSLEGGSIIATLFTGMKNREEKTVGMKVNGVYKFPLAGELVCFDGRWNEHQMWNNTNEWRITAVIDIDRQYFTQVLEDVDEEKKEISRPKDSLTISEKSSLKFQKSFSKEEVEHYLNCQVNDKIEFLKINTLWLTENSGRKIYADHLDENTVTIFLNSNLSKIDMYFKNYKEYYDNKK